MKKISFRTDVLPLKNELFRLALRITLNREDAEDVVQETMIRVWNRRDQWEQIESIEAFCTTICRNLALDKTKRASNQDASLDNEGHDAPDHSYSANPEEQAVQRDRVERVRRLMDSYNFSLECEDSVRRYPSIVRTPEEQVMQRDRV